MTLDIATTKHSRVWMCGLGSLWEAECPQDHELCHYCYYLNLWNARKYQHQNHPASVLTLDAYSFVFHKLSGRDLHVLSKSESALENTSHKHIISERLLSIKIDTKHLALVKEHVALLREF